MVADRQRVALAAVQPPARAQLGGRRRRRAAQAAGARRGEGQARRASRGFSGGASQRPSSADDGLDVVDVELAGDVGAAEAELSGRAHDPRDRGGRAHRERRTRRPVPGTRVPSQNSTAKGRSGMARSSSRASGWALGLRIGFSSLPAASASRH